MVKKNSQLHDLTTQQINSFGYKRITKKST